MFGFGKSKKSKQPDPSPAARGASARSEPAAPAPAPSGPRLSGDHVIVFSAAQLAQRMPTPAEVPQISARLGSVVSGLQTALLSGGDKSLTSGATIHALSFRLPDALERAASGKKVRVSMLARSADAGRLEFGVAYSTNEVGNSGWRPFLAAASLEEFSFEYDVPPMIKGNGDYVGILPDMNGAGRTLEVAAIAVSVVK